MQQNDKKEQGGKGLEELNRRQFFIKVGTASLAVAGCGSLAFAVRYLSPNVLYEPSPVVSAGKPEHYPENSVTLDPPLGSLCRALRQRVLCPERRLYAPRLLNGLEAGG